jgi:uncharacterized ion transporter superfamily protein YfcC
VVPGSFELLDEDIDLPVWNLLTVVPRGLAGAQGVIFLVLILGGALAVVRSTGSIDAGIGWLIHRFEHRPALVVFLSTLLIGNSIVPI